MPYCNLNSSEIVEQTKIMIMNSEVLKAKTDLAGFYDQVAKWNSESIKSISDKKVVVAQFSYDVRVYSHRKNENCPCTVERDLHFSISVCNDKLYAVVNGNLYYCAEIAANEVSGAVAQKVGVKAAADIYAPMFEKNGYIYDRCEIQNWTYDSKACDCYTEYTIGYVHTNGDADSVTIVGSGNALALCTCPYGCGTEEPVAEEAEEAAVAKKGKKKAKKALEDDDEVIEVVEVPSKGSSVLKTVVSVIGLIAVAAVAALYITGNLF